MINRENFFFNFFSSSIRDMRMTEIRPVTLHGVCSNVCLWLLFICFVMVSSEPLSFKTKNTPWDRATDINKPNGWCFVCNLKCVLQSWLHPKLRYFNIQCSLVIRMASCGFVVYMQCRSQQTNAILLWNK